MLTKTEIQKRLRESYAPDMVPESPYPADLLVSHPQSAAVLITFFQKTDGWHLLFIRRTVTPNDRHSGQVAFPGGRCASSDLTPESTALREAQEEVGIDSTDVQILGRVRDMITITNYQVSIVVGVIPWPYPCTPQAEEVDRIFSIPLNWLINPENREVRMRGLQLLGLDVPVIYFNEYDGELLWGATARMTLLLLEALGFAQPLQRYAQ